MVLSIMVSGMSSAGKAARAFKSIQKDFFMKVIGRRTRSMDEEDSCGLTELFTLVSSLKTKCKVKESTLGLTGENMRGSTLTIKRMDMEYLRGLMVVGTLVTGKTGSSTVLDTFIESMERLRRVNGLMASVFAGLKSQNLNE